MGRKLFMRVDPYALDRYTKKKVPRRRKKTLEAIWFLDILKRALQSLPPRELTIVYAVKVLRVEQDEVKDLFNVRQSNISYRLERAFYRIQLHKQIADTCSEAALRIVLYDVGMSEAAVRAVLGVVKTSSQSATAEVLKVTQGSIRHLFATALEKVAAAPKTIPNRDKAYQLLNLIQMNYNQLRSIASQSRWVWKIGDSNYPTPREKVKD